MQVSGLIHKDTNIKICTTHLAWGPHANGDSGCKWEEVKRLTFRTVLEAITEEELSEWREVKQRPASVHAERVARYYRTLLDNGLPDDMAVSITHTALQERAI